MAIVLEQLLHMNPLNLGNLIAGDNGLHNEVQSISLVEVPDRSEFMQPHLLAISSLYALADDVEGQLTLIRLLHEYKGSGLILFNVGEVVPSIHERLIELCNELDFPLVQMPLNVSYYEVLKVVIDQLLERQSQKLEASIKLHEAFVEQLLSTRDDYSALLNALAININHGLLFVNHNQKCVFTTSDSVWLAHGHAFIQDIQSAVGCVEHALQLDKRVVLIDDVPYLFLPIVNNRAYYGTVIVIDMATPTVQEQLSLLQAQKALCGLVFGHVRMDQYRERIYQEYVLDLLQNNYGNDSLIIAQGKELGMEIQNVRRVVVASPNLPEEDELQPKILHQLAQYAKRLLPDDIVVTFEELAQVVILILNHGQRDIQQAVESLRGIMETKCGHSPSLGVGSSCDSVQSIHQSYNQAVDAITLSRRLHQNASFIIHEKMRIYSLLFNNLPVEHVLAIILDYLEPVRDYDLRYNANLEETFEALLHYYGQTTLVADAMFVHKNTVLQRRNKIISLYENNPFESPHRLQFEIIFLLKRIFDL